MPNLRRDFLNGTPDQEDFGNEGLTVADNVIHDTEGFKQLNIQPSASFETANFYSGKALSSVRSMQIRSIGDRKNRIAAIAEDRATTAVMADLSVGAEGDSTAFTLISTGTLASADSIRIKAFSVAELGVGSFVACAAFSAELEDGSSTLYNITGDITYTLLSI